MKQLLYFATGIVVGGVFHDEIPYLNEINTQKLKKHIYGIYQAVSEAQ